jgi:tetratricopeptide (TPR) repeat protein
LTELELQAWESFEVGFFDEVIQFAENNPSSNFLSHLSLIAKIEEGQIPGKEEFPEGESRLKLIAEVYFDYFFKNHTRETLKKYVLYLQNKEALFCLPFFQIGIKLAFELEEYQACLFIMSKDTSGLNEEFYYRERIQSYFSLNKHTELIGYFKKYSQSIDMDLNIYMKVGLSLQALGKFKESELLLSKVPNSKKLPSFEEKREEFQEIIKDIPILETKENLSLQELKNLGFAYLFSNQFDKAEEVFKKATIYSVAK